MNGSLALVPLLAPLAHYAGAFVAGTQPGVRPARALAATRVASIVAIGVALTTAVLATLGGPLDSPLLAFGPVGLSVRLDALTSVMLLLVAILGGAVLGFSRNYLDGDARQGAFLRTLSTTVATVMLLVTAGNLVQLVAAWIGTSLALHGLLLFYQERTGAVRAARKKFLVARLGDACLVAAAVLLSRAFGTIELGPMLARAAAAQAAGTIPAGAGAAAVLVALAAALKSAQFPLHGWLAEVMETPTPVSALLHAGVLNGGPFVVARLAPVLLLSPAALHLLVVAGSVTALFASVVRVTQPSVKVSLAYSSAAHMGFTLLLCGLGAFPFAVLHLVAHSFYKAHAFLSSGSAVDVALASRVPTGSTVGTRALRLFAGVGIALAVVAAVATLCVVATGEQPVSLAVVAILAVGLTHLVVQGLETGGGAAVAGRTIAAAAATATAFFALELGATRVLRDAVPVAPPVGRATLALAAAVVVVFAVVSTLQLLLSGRAASPRWAALWVHLRNGLYANALLDRLIGLPRAAGSRHLTTETR